MSWVCRAIFGPPAHWFGNLRKAAFALFVAGVMPYALLGAQNSAVEDSVIAQGLAEMLQDARTVISNEQDLINNPELGDKHLTGKVAARSRGPAFFAGHRGRSNKDRSQVPGKGACCAP